MTLRVSETLSLPDDAALWTFGDLAIKGAGKTYAACVLAEEMIKAGVPIVAIDGLGIWWGLRVGADGGDGLPVVIFGGAHQDIPIPTKNEKGRDMVDEPRLKKVVEAILQAGISAVVDTSEFSKSMQRRIVAIVAGELYHLNADYGTRHVFVEEADMWCPQRISGDVAQAAGAIDDLVRRGGNFNLGCTLITQRSAVLNKDVLTQVNCLLVLRILHKLDKEAVKTWVESTAGEDQPKIARWYESLKDLKDGEAWVWNPQADIFDKVQIRRRETLHATREYFRERRIQNMRLMDVGEFVAKFKHAFEPRHAQEVIHTSVDGSIPQSRSSERTETSATVREATRSPPREAETSHVKASPLDEPKPATKELVAFTIKVTRLESPSTEGKVLYILKEHSSLKQGEILKAALDYGWAIPQSSASETLKSMLANGTLVFTAGKRYQIPSKVQVEMVQP